MTATADRFESLRTGETVRRDGPRLYRIDVPATLQGDLLYVELDTDAPVGALTLEVFFRNPQLTDLASNRAPWFTSVDILSSMELEPELEAAAVIDEVVCGGPCVIAPLGRGTIYVRVSTSRTTQLSYDIYAYALPFQDAGEPGISDCTGIGSASIIVEPVESFYEGALETLGDRDCFRTSGPVRRVTLSTTENNTGIFIEARVFNANTGQELDFSPLVVMPGRRVDFFPLAESVPVEIIVQARNNRAGPAGNSWYRLDFDF